MDVSPHPFLSVIIPAYQNGPILQLTLESLTRQSLPLDEFEVLVVDDGSRESLAPLVDGFADRLPVTCLRQEANGGRSVARNRGIEVARGEALLFLDSDSYAHPDLLARHVAFQRERAGAPRVLIGWRMEIDWAGLAALKRGKLPPPGAAEEYREDIRDHAYNRPHVRRDLARSQWLYAFSHNMSVDRATAEAVGGFDEAFVNWGFEDVEFSYRIFHHYGAREDVFEYDPLARCYHLPHARFVGKQVAGVAPNLEHIFRKHPRYDIELLIGAAVTLLPVIKRISWHIDALGAARKHGLGRVSALPARLRDELAESRNLVIGFDTATPPLGAGSVTFDHDAPPGEANLHLIGLRIPFPDQHFAAVVNVDMWRFLDANDLSSFVMEALRAGGRLELVWTQTGVDPADVLPAPFADDIEFVAQMLAPHLSVRRSVCAETGEVGWLTVEHAATVAQVGAEVA